MEVFVLDFQGHGPATNTGLLAASPHLVEDRLELRAELLARPQVALEGVFGPNGLPNAVGMDRPVIYAARDRIVVATGLSEPLLEKRQRLGPEVGACVDAQPVHLRG